MCRGAGQGPLGDEPVVGVDEGDDHGGARRKLLAEVLLEAGVDLLLGELPDDPTDGAAHDDRAEHRRVEQADEHADAATPLEPLAAEVVGGVGDLDLTVGGVLHQDDAVGLDGLVGDGSCQLVEVLLRRLDRRVRGHQQFERITHRVVSLIREIVRPSCHPPWWASSSHPGDMPSRRAMSHERSRCSQISIATSCGSASGQDSGFVGGAR